MAARNIYPPVTPGSLVAKPIRHGERGLLAKALVKAGLPADDVEVAGRLFWRFEDADELPLAFGGLEIHGQEALLRSLLTLPPAQKRGVGRAVVALLEVEAMARGCRRVWLLTTDAVAFFAALGYAQHARETTPPAIRDTSQWQSLCPQSAAVMAKTLPRRSGPAGAVRPSG